MNRRPLIKYIARLTPEGRDAVFGFIDYAEQCGWDDLRCEKWWRERVRESIINGKAKDDDAEGLGRQGNGQAGEGDTD